jgi:hypothetical protein
MRLTGKIEELGEICLHVPEPLFPPKYPQGLGLIVLKYTWWQGYYFLSLPAHKTWLFGLDSNRIEGRCEITSVSDSSNSSSEFYRNIHKIICRHICC